MKASTRKATAQQLVATAQDLLKESQELRTKADSLSSDPAEQLRLLEEATAKALSARDIGEKAKRVAKGSG